MFWKRDRRDRELDDELQSHFQMARRDRIDRGETRADAEKSAQREFGNEGLVKEITRDMWGWGWIADLGHDLRFAFRMLRKNPGFTSVAVLTLALGIGVSTTLFTAFDAVALKRLPVKDSQNVVRMLRWFASGDQGDVQFSFSYPEYIYYRDRNDVFSGLVAASWPMRELVSVRTGDGA